VLETLLISVPPSVDPVHNAAKIPPKSFKDYEPGDIKYLPPMPNEDAHRYLYVAIDRVSRWVYVELLPTKSAAYVSAFLKRLTQTALFKIVKVLTDNGKEFSDRSCAIGPREPADQHLFDRVFAKQGIEYRLIQPRHLQPNDII